MKLLKEKSLMKSLEWKKQEGEDELCGRYKSVYFQGNNEVIQATLTITKQSGVYHLEWISNNGNFTGNSCEICDNQLMVSYISK
jgi:hypothetical protein